MSRPEADKPAGAKRTSTLPYFQLDGGQVLLDCMGFSMEERGMYLSLMAIYWEGGCRLPPQETLLRKLSLRGQKAAATLDRVVQEFFPDGVNAHLDQCKENALQTSRRNAESARSGHQRRRQEAGMSPKPQDAEGDPSDF